MDSTVSLSTNDAVKKTSVRALLLLFVNCTIWLAGSLLFMYLERPVEGVHKCGVRRVRRDFLDNLWSEASVLDEADWKSLARKKLETFEEEIHTAVEAGLNSYSSQTVWTPSNAILYTFTLSTTIGYGSLTPATPWVRLFSIVYAGIACPLFAALLGEVAQLITLLAPKVYCRPNGASLISVLGCLIVHSWLGTILMAYLFEWSLQDSLYFVGTTVTTIGFGDIVPEDTFTFLCTSWYIVTGLAVYSIYQDAMTALVSTWLENLLDRRARTKLPPGKSHSD